MIDIEDYVDLSHISTSASSEDFWCCLHANNFWLLIIASLGNKKASKEEVMQSKSRP